MQNDIKLFEQKKIRSVYDEEKDILEDAAQFDDGRAAKIATAIEGRIQTLRSMTM